MLPLLMILAPGWGSLGDLLAVFVLLPAAGGFIITLVPRLVFNPRRSWPIVLAAGPVVGITAWAMSKNLQVPDPPGLTDLPSHTVIFGAPALVGAFFARFVPVSSKRVSRGVGADLRSSKIRLGSVAVGVVVAMMTATLLDGILRAFLPATSTALPLGLVLAGFACTTLGAYLAADRAGGCFRLHGLLVAAILLAISVASLVAFAISSPDEAGTAGSLWSAILGWALLGAGGLLGACLAESRASAA